MYSTFKNILHLLIFIFLFSSLFLYCSSYFSLSKFFLWLSLFIFLHHISQKKHTHRDSNREKYQREKVDQSWYHNNVKKTTKIGCANNKYGRFIIYINLYRWYIKFHGFRLKFRHFQMETNLVISGWSQSVIYIYSTSILDLLIRVNMFYWCLVSEQSSL